MTPARCPTPEVVGGKEPTSLCHRPPDQSQMVKTVRSTCGLMMAQNRMAMVIVTAVGPDTGHSCMQTEGLT